MTIDEGYLGNSSLKKPGTEISYSEEQLVEIAKCMNDPIYFIRNYVKIVNVDRGLVPFEMWPFQEDMVRDFHNNRFCIAKMPRQVGKTTTTVGYMLWSVLFNDNYSIAILANKGSLAREILGRVQYAYEYLPTWMQQGILVWNRGNIELENKSKIYAYATSGAGVRGGTYNLVFLDEFAFVPNNIAEEFFTSTYPVISSGTTTKVIIVSTPNGLNLFYKMWKDATEKRSLYKPVEVHWSMVPGRDQKWKEETIRNTSEEQFRQEFETEFIGSTATLISAAKLKSLSYETPIESSDGFDVYEYPQKGSMYVITVDSSEGVGLDYSAFSVIDVTSIPYRQVAKYRNNKIPTLIYPTLIYSAGMKYNEAFILCETNNIGQQVVDILHYDLEYDNIFKLEHHNIKGQHISAGFKRSVSFGLRTTTSVKKIGCANFKAMVESDKLIINDQDTLLELYTFSRDKDTYKAEEGNHDDMAMTLVMFCWLAAQSFFKETTNGDIRRRLVEEQNLLVEENIAPVGIFDDGIKEEVIDDGTNRWSFVQDRGYPSSIL